MNKELHDQEKNDAVKEAARIMGSIGGKSGRGEAKRRPSEICRMAVAKRWDNYRKRKASADSSTSA